MEIIRNDAKIKKYSQAVKIGNVVALIILAMGMLISFQGNPGLIFVQWLALCIGIIVWQVSLNVGWRYSRRPRPDEMLDANLKTAKGVMYHHVLPARHVLLTRSGPVVLFPIVNDGEISVSGENGDIWRVKKPLFRRFFSQQPRLISPTRDVEQELGQLVGYIKDHAPDLDELPIGAAIVSMNPVAVLDTEESRIPVVKLSDLKKFIRRQTGKPLPKQEYDTLKQIFGDAAVTTS